MQQKNNSSFWLSIMALSVLVMVAGCKAVPTYQKPSSLQLPPAFAGQTDSTSMADLPWRQIFTDPYLEALIDTSLRNNWDLQIAMQRIEIARANYRQSTGALLPAVFAAANAGVDRYTGKRDKDVSNLPGGIPSSALFLGLQSTWEIDIWNKLKSRKRAALQRFFSSQQGLLLVKTMLVAEVSKRYYDLLMLDKQIAIVRKNIDLQQAAADVISIQKEAGRATELAVRQFQAQLINTKSLEVSYQQQLIETENQLNSLIGRMPQAIERTDTIIVNNTFTTFQAGLPSALLLRRPDIQQIAFEMLAFEADVEAARAQFFPTVTISPYVGFNSFNPAELLTPASIVFGLVGGLTAPVFNRIAIKSNYRRSEASAREVFYNYQKTITNSYIEVSTNLSRINNYKKIYDLKKEQTQTLEEAVSTSKDLYLAGYASYLEVILAQANVLEAELNMVSAKNNINQSVIDLYHSLGGGWK